MSHSAERAPQHSPVALPACVRARHDGWIESLAWSLVPESATWRLEGARERRYVKVARLGGEPTLAAERDRMRWAAGRLAVPRVLDYGVEGSVEWLLTASLPGVDATRVETPAGPEPLVRLLARGLRTFHEVSAEDCPFRFDVETAMSRVHRRAEAGRIDPTRHFHPEHRDLTLATALTELEESRPHTEDLVLCHGDYCFPNVLVSGDRVTGYLDLGELGVADRWWDLAVSTWSVSWNVGPGWEETFLSAYGVEADSARNRFFRLLYDLAS